MRLGDARRRRAAGPKNAKRRRRAVRWIVTQTYVIPMWYRIKSNLICSMGLRLFVIIGIKFGFFPTIRFWITSSYWGSNEWTYLITKGIAQQQMLMGPKITAFTQTYINQWLSMPSTWLGEYVNGTFYSAFQKIVPRWVETPAKSYLTDELSISPHVPGFSYLEWQYYYAKDSVWERQAEGVKAGWLVLA